MRRTRSAVARRRGRRHLRPRPSARAPRGRRLEYGCSSAQVCRYARVPRVASPFVELDVEGRVVRVSNPDKVYFRAQGDEARPRRVLPLGRRRHRPRAPRPADVPQAPSGRCRLRADLPEARSRESPGLGRDRARDVSVGAARRRALRDRGRAGDVGGEPRHARLPPLARAAADVDHPDELRIDIDPQPGTGFNARSRWLRSCGKCSARSATRAGRRRRATAASTSPAGSSRTGTSRGAACRTCIRSRGRAAGAEARHDRLVEGGERAAGLHRLQPERPRPHDRLGVLRARATRCDRVRAGDLGRAARRGDGGSQPCDDAEAIEEAGTSRPGSTIRYATSACCWSGWSVTRPRATARHRTRRTSRRCQASRAACSLRRSGLTRTRRYRRR